MKYTWHPASGTDIVPIMQIAQTHFQTEIDDIFVPDPVAYSRNVATAVINQFYTPGSELITVAKSMIQRYLGLSVDNTQSASTVVR
jgi:tRNA nucleotidyltransferase (CCA-adding enzyme)